MNQIRYYIMNLFENTLYKKIIENKNFDFNNLNLLPSDGEVYYYGKILDFQKSQYYFEKLSENIEWKNDEVVIFGKHIITPRKVAWYGKKEYEYKYSNISKKAILWTKELIELKEIVENISNETFNSCLLNLYHNGNEGMAWHTDSEKYLKKDGAIASLSIGADRKFSFKHIQTKESISLQLENGSLLIMKGKTQTNWLHSLPKSKKITTPRINLTFRTII